LHPNRKKIMSMNSIKIFFSLVLSVLLFNSCEKEVNINADWEDITIVYGLINPNDSVSYLRIEKAYLSDGDIFQDAQIADSNLYKNFLEVEIYSNNKTIVFDTITIFNKEDGIFYAPRMQVYYAVTKNQLNTNDIYKLKVTNPESGKKITSETKLIDASHISFDYPNYSVSFVNDKEIIFNAIKGALYYQLNIRFHYTEGIISGNDTSFSAEYVDWVFPAIYSSDDLGGEELEIPYFGEEFYANLNSHIPHINNVIRYGGQAELIISSADRTFQTYLDLNKPSNSIVQDRPAFTNINNGYGIFASRSVGGKMVSLNSKSEKKLVDDYPDLKFQF